MLIRMTAQIFALTLLLPLGTAFGSDLGSADVISTQACRGGGGEGPTPAMDITFGLPKGVSWVQTDKNAMIQDFVYWEKKNFLAYRTTANKIFELDLGAVDATSTKASRYLAESDIPLSSVVDRAERYLVTSLVPHVLDTFDYTPKWLQYPKTEYDLQHLYWHEDSLQPDTLYSFETVFNVQTQTLKIYNYHARKDEITSCTLTLPENERYYIGEGHEYPKIFLYKTKVENGETWVSYYDVRLPIIFSGGECTLHQVKEVHQIPLPGKITHVYRFPPLERDTPDLFVVRTDDPVKNFLWDDCPNDCRTYNLGKREVMIPNTNQPVIATWGEKDGLSLIYPRNQINGQPTYVQPLRSYTQFPIKKENLWLTNDGQKLFVAVTADSLKKSAGTEDTGRMLFQVPLK